MRCRHYREERLRKAALDAATTEASSRVIEPGTVKLLVIYLCNIRVIHNVLTDFLEGCFISNDMVIIIALPYGIVLIPRPVLPTP